MPRPVSQIISAWLGALGVGVGAVCGCGGESPGPLEHPPAAGGIRIVSLSPGITSTVRALGAGERLVGRTPWCQGIDGVAVVGSLLDLDAEALLRVSPDVILVQPPAQGESRQLDELARASGWRTHRYRLDSLDEVVSLMRQLPLVISQPGDPDDLAKLQAKAAALCAELEAALAPSHLAPDAGRVLLLLASAEGADTIAFGAGTYLGDALERLGCQNAITRSGYPALGVEDIVTIDPDSVIILGVRGRGTADRLAQMMPRASFALVDAPELLQPGAGAIEGMRSLRSAVEEVATRRRGLQ